MKKLRFLLVATLSIWDYDVNNYSTLVIFILFLLEIGFEEEVDEG